MLFFTFSPVHLFTPIPTNAQPDVGNFAHRKLQYKTSEINHIGHKISPKTPRNSLTAKKILFFYLQRFAYQH